MYKRIYFIALVPNTKFGVKKHTIYLFNRDEKIVIPVEVKNTEALMFLTGKTHIDDNAPSVFKAVQTLIEGFSAKLISITVYKHQNGTFYTYLNLICGEKHLELAMEFADAFAISRLFDAPLYINHRVLVKKGIKVSKEIIRDALMEDY
ncbi:bifunctional nuclease domain-containing protein [Patescibacteria group bacterium]